MVQIPRRLSRTCTREAMSVSKGKVAMLGAATAANKKNRSRKNSPAIRYESTNQQRDENIPAQWRNYAVDVSIRKNNSIQSKWVLCETRTRMRKLHHQTCPAWMMIGGVEQPKRTLLGVPLTRRRRRRNPQVFARFVDSFPPRVQPARLTDDDRRPIQGDYRRPEETVIVIDRCCVALVCSFGNGRHG